MEDDQLESIVIYLCVQNSCSKTWYKSVGLICISMFSTRLITADIETFMNLSSSSNWISMWLNFVYQISLFSIISLIYVYIHLYFCDVVLGIDAH